MDGKIDTVHEAIEGLLRAANRNVGGMAPGVIASWCYKALATLSAHDEAIRRECAYKAKQAILSAPHDNPTRAYAASLAEEAILGAEPEQDARAAQKAADDRAYAWRHEMMGDSEPAQDDGKTEVTMTMIENGDLSISWECSGCKGIIDDANYIESIEKCPRCGATIREFVYIEEDEE